MSCELAIFAIPKARKDAVGSWREQAQGRELEVRVCAAPEKGKATKAIIKVLAAFFDVAARDVVLLSGQTSRHKRFEIAVDEDHFNKCLSKIEV